MAEISGIDPLTTGKTMYPEENVKGSSTFGQVAVHQPASSVTPNPMPKGKIKNGTKDEQLEVAEARKKKAQSVVK